MTDSFDSMIGQETAVAALRTAITAPLPAYLLVGPNGCGLRTAATGLAAELLARDSEDPERDRRLALAEEHPDFILFERSGPALTTEEAREIVRVSVTSPYEGNCKVIFVEDIDLAQGSAPMILKVLEEPPDSTHFILTAQQVPPELATISSRCTTIEFNPINRQELLKLLISSGLDHEHSSVVATAANGSVDRAMLLAADQTALDRWNAWSCLPRDLDGTGSRAAAAVDKLLAMIESAAGPLQERHERERDDLNKRAEELGERGLGRRGMEERHKRELRRLRTDELLMGMTAVGLAIREGSSDGSVDPALGSESLSSVIEVSKDLRRNGNERLLLQQLFVHLRPR